MIDSGICYLPGGDSRGSLCVTSGFERMRYVLLHTNGTDCQLFKLNSKGTFQIWTKETLEEYGFHPTRAPYYMVLRFNPQPIKILQCPNLIMGKNTFKAKIMPLSLFIGIN